MILNYLLLPVVFFIGSITSYQDFKFGKIKNKWIILGSLWGTGVYPVLCLWLFLSGYFHFFSNAGDYISFPYVFDALLNAALALIIGYMFWYFDLWSAGDAKLFFVFSLLLPLTFYSRSYLPFFPSFALLINVFAPAMIFLFLQKIFIILRDTFGRARQLRDPKQSWNKIKKYFSDNGHAFLKSSLSFALILLSFMLFRQMIQRHLNIRQEFSSIVFLFFVFGTSGFLRNALKNNYVLIIFTCLISIYLAISGFEAVKTIISAIHQSLILMVAFPIVLFVFSYSAKKINSQKMPFAVWLFLGVAITIVLKGSVVSSYIEIDPRKILMIFGIG